MDLEFSKNIGQIKLALMDTAQQAENRHLQVYQEKIQCKPRCTGCCSRLISISMSEAVLIYEYLKENGVWFDVKKAAKSQLPLVQKTKPLSWFKMNLKCPVLSPDTGLCRAYAMRPAICSTHFVTSAAEMCDPWSPSNGKYSPIDFSDLYIKFKQRIDDSVRGFGILSLELPIQIALLLAEKINTLSGLSEEQATALMYNEL